MNAEVKGLLEKIRDEAKTGREDLMGLVKEQQEQIDRFGETREETVGKIEKAEERLSKLGEELAGVEEKMGNIDAMLGRGTLPGGGREAAKSIGRQFVESDSFKSYGRNGHGESSPMITKTVFGPVERRAATLTNDRGTAFGAMGIFIEPDEMEALRPIQQPLTIRDLMPVFPTTSDTVHYIEYLGFANVYTELDASALSSASTVTVKSTAGLFVGQKIQIGAIDPDTSTSHTISAINQTTRVVTISGTLGVARNANDPVTATAIGMTAHGQQKPESSFRMRERQHPIGTMAHYIVAHRQTLSDVPQLEGLVNTELVYGLKQSEEEQILYGNGESPNLQGILNNTSVQNHGTFAGDKARESWRMDHIRRAITKAQVSQMPPTALLIHPNDWAEIELAKGSDGHYLQGVVVSDGRVERMWRVPVLVTMAIREQEFLLGSFALGGYLLDREDASVRLSDSHKDFFTSNQVAILAEERIGLAIRRPQAFVKGSFA